MGLFNISITGVGGNGCERNARPGDKLHARCGRFTCPDCAAFEFMQRLRQMGMLNTTEASATFTHWPGRPEQVVDDMLKNERKSGHF
jgi:hypothetical protein